MAQPTGQVHDWTPAYCDFGFDAFHILRLCTCVAWLLEAVLPAWDKVTSWPERPWKTGAWDSETKELSMFEVAPPVILLGSLEAGKFKQELGDFISSQFPPTLTGAAWFASLRGWRRHLQASQSSCCLNILFAEVGRPLPTSPALPQHKWRGSSFDICQQDVQQNVWRQQRFITWGQASLFSQLLILGWSWNQRTPYQGNVHRPVYTNDWVISFQLGNLSNIILMLLFSIITLILMFRAPHSICVKGLL